MLRPVTHIRNVEQRVPRQLPIDGQVPGVGCGHFVVVVWRGVNAACGRRVASRSLQRNLSEGDRLPSRRIVGCHVLRRAERTAVIVVLVIPYVLSPTAADNGFPITLHVVGKTYARRGVGDMDWRS